MSASRSLPTCVLLFMTLVYLTLSASQFNLLCGALPTSRAT